MTSPITLYWLIAAHGPQEEKCPVCGTIIKIEFKPDPGFFEFFDRSQRTFVLTGKWPVIPEPMPVVVPPPPPPPKPTPLWRGRLTGHSNARDEAGNVVALIPKGTEVDVWLEAPDIKGWTERLFIDPAGTAPRRHVWEKLVERI